MTSRSRSDFFTPNVERGTPELRARHRVEVEPIDYRGLMLRSRVVDQCELDHLFLRRSITAPQHSAGECFMDVLARSGAWPRSADPTPRAAGALRDAEAAISSRIMAASGAFSALRQVSDASRQATMIVVLMNLPVHQDLIPPLRLGLDALVRHFGTSGARDPRGEPGPSERRAKKKRATG